MKKIEDIIFWMVEQMQLAMPIETKYECEGACDGVLEYPCVYCKTIPPEHLSAKESASQEH